MTQKDPDKVLKETVEKTIEVVTDYVEPVPRNAEETVQQVIETVDNDEVKAAVEASDQRREATGEAMNSQHPEHENDNAGQDHKMSQSQNEKNVEAGQQGTNKPWKEPGAASNGRPRGTDDVVEKEQQKRKANEEKAAD